MRKRSWSHALLILNVVLATVLLATALNGPLSPQAASAQATTGIPNAAEQRHELITEMRALRKSVEAFQKLIRSGSVKVEVSNLDAITARSDGD